MAMIPPYDDVLEDLREAAKAGNLPIVQQLLPQLQPSMMNTTYYKDPAVSHYENVRNVLNKAASNGRNLLVKYLLDSGAPLEDWMGGFCIDSCESDPTDILTTYLEHGWEINADDTEGTALTRALRKNNPELLTFLLTHGADPNLPAATSRDAFRTRQHFISAALPRRPLEWASLSQPLSTVQLLVNHGADVRSCNALHAAAGSSLGGRVPIMRYLVESGADVNAVEFSSEADAAFWKEFGQVRPWGTPLHYAEERRVEENARFLRERGADGGKRDPVMGKTPREWREMGREWRRGVAVERAGGEGPMRGWVGEARGVRREA